jgi:hypothetical protein
MSTLNSLGAGLKSRAVAWLTAAVAGLFVAYCAAWIGAAIVMQDQAAKWVAAQRTAGLTITHGEPLLSGFPMRVVASYPGWEVAAPVTAGGWTWRTAAVRLIARPWSPLGFTADLSGLHTLTGALTPPGIAAWIKAARVDIAPRLTADGRIGEVAATLKDVRVSQTAEGPSTLSLDAGALVIAKVQGDEPDNRPIWRLEADGSQFGVPADIRMGPFAPRLERVRLIAELLGPLGSGPLPTALDAWREAGGTLEVRDFALDWPPLSVAASGTLSLDAGLQPIGALTARFQGFFETVDALAERGSVRSTQASMAKVMLALLMRTPDDGGPPELSIAVTLQDRKLYTGPVALMDMPEIAWPTDLELKLP